MPTSGLEKPSKFVSLLTAYDATQTIKAKMLLNRADIHYVTRNEVVFNAIGFLPFGPIEFLVREDQYTEAMAQIEGLFEIDLNDIPEKCPACGTPTKKGVVDCISCGLFLG